MSLVGSLPLLLALVTSPLVAAAPAHAGKGHHVAKVSLEAARKTALVRVPGTIKHEELEKEDGRWIYSFEIVPTGGKKGFIKEVNVDADSGAIVAVETERG
jgi:uncharacterized membrane protein YkoI